VLDFLKKYGQNLKSDIDETPIPSFSFTDNNDDSGASSQVGTNAIGVLFSILYSVRMNMQ